MLIGGDLFDFVDEQPEVSVKRLGRYRANAGDDRAHSGRNSADDASYGSNGASPSPPAVANPEDQQGEHGKHAQKNEFDSSAERGRRNEIHQTDACEREHRHVVQKIETRDRREAGFVVAFQISSQ
ncbi:hypothetical protein JCM18750_27830 [Halostagnicola bangensis]